MGRKMKNVITDLGLNPDGTTDNLAALNAAIAAYAVADGAWFWPAGTYRLSATPSVIPNSSVWYGEGMTLTAIKGTRAAPGGGAVLSLTNSQNVTLRALHITTTDDANACDQCAIIGGSNNLFCDGVKLSFGYSAGFRMPARATRLRFMNGEVTAIHQDFSASGFTGELADSLIANTWFHNNATESSNTRHCIYINGATNPTNVAIEGCIFNSWGGGTAVGLKGDSSGSVTGAAYNLSVSGCTFDTTGVGGSCIGPQGVQGLNISNNSFFFGSFGSQGIQITGDCWNFNIDGNNFMSPPTETDGVAISLANGNGGGRITNNMLAMANARYDVSSGVNVFGSVGNLEIANNTFSGMGNAILFSTAAVFSPNNVGVGNIYCHDNNFNIPPGAISVATGGRVVPGLSVAGQSAAIVVDGRCSTLQMLDNKSTGFTYDLVFTTNVVATGSAGQADTVQYRLIATPVVICTNSAVPTNVTRGAKAFVPVDVTALNAHGFAVSVF